MHYQISQAAFVQGASKGIGLALLRKLLDADEHDFIFASSRNPSTCEALSRLAESHQERLVLLAIDVTEEDTIRAAAEEIDKSSVAISLLVNCAGLLHAEGLQPERRLRDIDISQLERLFSVNTFGPLLVAKHCSRFFCKTSRTVLANISARVASIEDNQLGGWYGYRGSKAAQNMFTKNLSIELKRSHQGIICIALHPGSVDTGLSKPFQNNIPPAKLFSTERAARQLLSVIADLHEEDNGKFFAWDGTTITW